MHLGSRALLLGLLFIATNAIGARPAEAVSLTRISAGLDFTCRVTAAGAVQCWGSNSNGQLGDGTTNDRRTPVTVSGLASGVISVTAGQFHACALLSGGAVQCWGDNTYGQLGDGTTTQRRTPAAVSGLSSGISAIVAGGLHTCALTDGGGVLCWGNNHRSQNPPASVIPVQVSGLSNGVTAIASGIQHTCALSSDGGVMCWGGISTIVTWLSPTAIPGLSSGVSVIGQGLTHLSCFVLMVSGPRCWSPNFQTAGFLDLKSVDGLPLDITAFGSGSFHSCALTSGAAVYCWGTNDSGQVGDGTSGNVRSTAAAVAGLPNGINAVAAGDHHSCAQSSVGVTMCWGRNDKGQLGDGTTAYRFRPVVVNPGLTLPSLTMAAVNTGTALTAQTSAQVVRLTQNPVASARWTATADTPWLTVTPASGSLSTPITIGVKFDPSLPLSGTVTGAISFALSGTTETAGPLVVTLTLVPSTAAPSGPFGTMDTPTGDATPLAGSVAVSGWALDNIGVLPRFDSWIFKDISP